MSGSSHGLRPIRGLAFGRAPAVCLSFVTGACSPALDWREVHLPGPEAVATYPCRPVEQSRQVHLAGREVVMRLHACQATGSTYAVAMVEVGDPAQVGAVLAALRGTALGKFGPQQPAQPTSPGAWPVRGMTPEAEAGRWVATHAGELGQAAWRIETAVFARGTWALQASVVGPDSQAARAAAALFFEGLRFEP